MKGRPYHNTLHNTMRPASIEEINEALSNSFAAIREDMNSMKRAISEQQRQMSQIAGNTAIALQKTEKELGNLRSATESPETSDLKAYMETQITALQSQIMFLREELSSKKQNGPSESQLKKQQEHMHKEMEHKLNDIQQFLEQRTDDMERRWKQNEEHFQDSLKPIHHDLRHINMVIEKIDQQSTTLHTTHGKKSMELEQEISTVKELQKNLFHYQKSMETTLKEMREEMHKKIAAETQASLAKHSFTNMKEHDSVKVQIIQLQEDIKTLSTLNAPMKALTEHMRTLERQMHTAVEKTNEEFSHLHAEMRSVRLSHSKEEIDTLRERMHKTAMELETSREEQRSLFEELIADMRREMEVEQKTLSNRLNLLKQEVETDVSSMKSSVDKTLDEFQTKHVEMKKETTNQITALTVMITEKFNDIHSTTDKILEESSKKTEVATLKERLSTFEKTMKDSLAEIHKQILVNEKTSSQVHKDIRSSLETKSTQLQKHLDMQGTNISSQQTILTKVTHEIKNLHSISQANSDSSKRLNRLFEQFSQLKGIPLPEDKGLLHSVKDLFKTTKKKPELIKHLEVRQVREEKEHTPLVRIESIGPQKKKSDQPLGVLTKIGLEEGLISEKDL